MIICAAVYSQGIYGPFLYDDSASLSPLADIRTDYFWHDTLNYIFGNKTGPLGRPVAMTSFVLNLNYWPRSPEIFKLTNIIVHLLSGIVIYLFVTKLVPLVEPTINSKRASAIALLVSAFWLLHPLHVSTTLYVIQRMAQLSTLFSVLALNAFIRFIPSLSVSDTSRPFIWPSLILVFLISMAVLSKENSLLIFPIMLLINYSQHNKKVSSTYKIWSAGLIILPSVICLLALFYKSTNHILGLEYKGISITQKLLTEFRALSDYLSQILIPDISRMSIFHDDMIVSQSLFSPSSTVLSLLLIIGLIALLITNIRRIYKISIAWFLIWHILESTVLPLDLYFEHRNYTASIGPLLALAYGIFHISDKANIKSNLSSSVMAIVYGLFLSISLSTLTKLWADEETLLIHWLTNHEKSKNTLISLVQYYEKNDKLQLAHSITVKSLDYDHLENDLSIHLKLYTQECLLALDTKSTLHKLNLLTSNSSAYSPSVQQLYASLVINILNGHCKPKDIDSLHQLLNSIENNAPQRINGQWLTDVQSKHAFLYLHYNQLSKALTLFKKSYRLHTPDIAVAVIDINLKLRNFTQAQLWINVTNRNHLKANQSEQILKDLEILQRRLNNLTKNK